MHWHFNKIPSEKGNEVLSLFESRDYFSIVVLFSKWGVIPGGCDGCGLSSYVPGFMIYALDKQLIPLDYADTEILKRIDTIEKGCT